MAAALAVLGALDVRALPADRKITQYVRRAWTVEQGLPHGTIRGLAQTADGYLWLATYEGLVRFNGEMFRILDKANSPAVLSNSIVTLARTTDDTLWLGTLAGLMRYRDGRFQTIAMSGGPDIVHALAPAPDGAVWVGTAHGRVMRIDGERATLLPATLPNTPITTLAASGDALWIGSTAGLARFRGGKLEKWTTAQGLSSDAVVSLLPDGDDAVLVGTASGLNRIAGGRVETIPGLPTDQVTALRRDREGNLWAGTYSSGLFRLDTRTGSTRITAYGIGDGLLNPTVRTIFEDDEGSLWVGTNGGVEQLRAGAFVTWNERDGLADAVARVIFEDRDGVIWAGTANGVSRWDGQRFVKLDDRRLTGILSMAQGRDGTRWFGTSNGVFRVSGGETRHLTTANGLSNNTTRAIHEDRRGDVWIATDFGLNRIRRTGEIDNFSGRGGLGTDYAMAIAETPDGRIWVATGGGLAEYNGHGFKLHAAPSSLPSNRLFALAADRDGTVWITTDGDGLVRYRNGRASAITTREGLPTDKILSLVDDGNGNFWFGTVRGAYKVAKRDLHGVADGGMPRLHSVLYDENDGLGSRQCNGVANPAALRSRDGRVWFVTANGVSALTSTRSQPLPVRKPLVERVLINGADATGRSLASIAPGAERLEFEFAGLTFITPERLRFRYRLQGYDKEWIDARSKRVASYTNLPGGAYSFELASSRDGVTWSSAEVPFELQPHFYETKWFIALAVLAVIALLLAAHNVRLHITRERARHLEQIVEERTRQISEEKERTEVALREAEAAKREAERHERLTEEALAEAEEANRAKSIFLAATSHELRTPLNAIIGFSEILMQHVSKQLEPRQSRFLHNIHSSGNYLLGIINNILDLSKIEAGRMEIHPEPFLLRQEVGGICAVMKGVTTLRKITIDLDIPKELPIEADVTLVKQILYNLMSNAVKFSPDRSTVTVAARHLNADESPLGEDAVEIRVIDHGSGIDPKDHQIIFQMFRQAEGSRGERPQGTGLGLALVRRFVDLHRGTIRVESALGQGSTFILVLPSMQTRVTAHAEPLRQDAVV